MVAKAVGPAERGARLYGALEALQKDVQLPLEPYVPLLPSAAGLHDQNIAAARVQLDTATFESAWAEGRAMTLEEAVAYALKGE